MAYKEIADDKGEALELQICLAHIPFRDKDPLHKT